ncbi:MAG: mandelate racemase/muconate lactonizing enzyme family protein, partial [Chloroflexi bacterium]|nr:mandelate racemase/muconate lactonizing enzyme family protein [Chloroflexota bacterium]
LQDQEFFNAFVDQHVMDAAPGVPPVVDGYFALPNGPGLGVTLDEDMIAAHPSSGTHFNLFVDDWHKRQSGK